MLNIEINNHKKAVDRYNYIRGTCSLPRVTEDLHSSNSCTIATRIVWSSYSSSKNRNKYYMMQERKRMWFVSPLTNTNALMP